MLCEQFGVLKLGAHWYTRAMNLVEEEKVCYLRRIYETLLSLNVNPDVLLSYTFEGSSISRASNMLSYAGAFILLYK